LPHRAWAAPDPSDIRAEANSAGNSESPATCNPCLLPSHSIWFSRWPVSTAHKTPNAAAASLESWATSDLPSPHSRRTKGKFANLRCPSSTQYRGILHAPVCSAAWGRCGDRGLHVQFPDIE
jgi:hypothetical protein